MKEKIRKVGVLIILIQFLLVNFAPLMYANENKSSYNSDWTEYNGGWKIIESTSKRILEIMISQSHYADFVSNTKLNYGNNTDEYANELHVQEDDGIYRVVMPTDYFTNKNYGAKTVTGFDFTGALENENLQNLPDFSAWSEDSIFKLNFENCRIKDLANVLENNMEKLEKCNIKLKGNDISKSGYDIKTSEEAKNLGIVIGSKPTVLGTLMVQYLGEDKNTISPIKQITGVIGKNVSVPINEIEGYTFSKANGGTVIFLNGNLDEMIDSLIAADRAERLKGE